MNKPERGYFESKHGYDWEVVGFNQRDHIVQIRYGDTRCESLALTREDLQQMLDTLPAPGLDTLEENDIDVAIDAFQADMQKKIRAVVMRRMKEWQARYPKRSLGFMDAMGATMLHVTRTVPNAIGDKTYDVTDYHRYGTLGSWMARDVFESLRELVCWYNDVADQTSIGIADIVVGEPFWPVHIKGNKHFEVDPREYDKEESA